MRTYSSVSKKTYGGRRSSGSKKTKHLKQELVFGKICAGLIRFGLTLNDVDRKGLRDPFYTVDLGCADVVSVEAGVEAVDENASVPVHSEVHSRWDGGTVVHAQAQLGGWWVRQEAGQHVLFPFLPHHSQGGAAGPEHTMWI